MGRSDKRSKGAPASGARLSRELRPYEPTWLDRQYRKALRVLPPEEQEASKKELGDLLEALQTCQHPQKDPALARWKPTPYSGQGVPGLCEYRLGPRARVVARCVDPAPGQPILLVAATLVHDHERIKRLIATHKKRIKRSG